MLDTNIYIVLKKLLKRINAVVQKKMAIVKTMNGRHIKRVGFLLEANEVYLCTFRSQEKLQNRIITEYIPAL